MNRRESRRQRGFALLIVLWTIGFLALLGSRIVAAGRADTQLADNLKQEAVLEAAADGAVSRIVFLMMAVHDPAFQADGLAREVRIGATPVLVQIHNEGDRVNLNTASGALLRALIIDSGGPPGLANQLTAAILDWRTAGATPRPGGAKAPEYRGAGRNYGPPGEPFRSVGELQDVLGMTPDLFALLAPHLTVFTDGDPDLSTRDPIVARALADAAGVADVTELSQPVADEVLRISVTALGRGGARFAMVVVASTNFQNQSPSINILLRERSNGVDSDTLAARAE